MIGTKNDFVIYNKQTQRLSDFVYTRPAYHRSEKITKSGLRYTKITNKLVNNIQFPMIGRNWRTR